MSAPAVVNVVVIHAEAHPEEALRAMAELGGAWRWMFLGSSYQQMLRWRRALDGAAEQQRIARPLNECAARLRRPFLELIARLGRERQSLAWWTSRLAERSPFMSPLFLHCCYLHVVLQSNDEQLVVAAESAALAGTVARALASRGRVVARVGVGAEARERRGQRLRLGRAVAAFSRLFLRRRQAAAPLPERSDKPLVLMRTWIDDGCFEEDGHFRDRYYGPLRDWLLARGYDAVLVAVPFNNAGPPAALWERLRANGVRFIDPYALFGRREYLASLRLARERARMMFDGVTLDGVDVTDLFNDSARTTALDASTLEATLWHDFPRLLAARGFRPERFIDLYENLNYEKPLTLGLHEALPETRLVSFQHGIPAPQLLSLFVTAEEAEYAPLPDLVVCNGPLFRELLVNEGLPEGRVVEGGAIRFAYLREQPQVRREAGAHILISLPLPMDDAVELVLKTIEALGGSELHAGIKPHPMMAFPQLLAAAGVAALPPNFEVIAGSMAAALERSDVVVALSSSTVFETWCAGVPMVIVGRETAIDQNPLDWLPERHPVVYDPAEIAAEVQRVLRQPPASPSPELLARCFNPVDDTTLAAFLA
jgi:surface carbohydrate biosynthesis protein (TIGR04326 family)